MDVCKQSADADAWAMQAVSSSQTVTCSMGVAAASILVIGGSAGHEAPLAELSVRKLSLQVELLSASLTAQWAGSVSLSVRDGAQCAWEEVVAPLDLQLTLLTKRLRYVLNQPSTWPVWCCRWCCRWGLQW